MNGRRFSVLRSGALLVSCSLWVGSASPIPPATERSSEMMSVEPQNWSTWKEYAVYLVSQQLCEAVRNDREHACLSVIADMADKPTMAQIPQKSVSALEISGWHDASLLSNAGLRIAKIQTATRSAYRGSEGDFPQATDADRSETGLRAVPRVADSAVKDAIPGSLLVTILALVGIVAVARRDIPGKDVVDSINSGAKAASVTYLQTTGQCERLQQ